MVLNPFSEGLILLLVGIGCIVISKLFSIDLLTTTGATVIGLGLGYLGGNKVGGSNMLRLMTKKE